MEVMCGMVGMRYASGGAGGAGGAGGYADPARHCLVSTRGPALHGGRRSYTDHCHTQAPPWRIGSEIVRCTVLIGSEIVHCTVLMKPHNMTVHSSSSSSLLMNKRSLPPPWPSVGALTLVNNLRGLLSAQGGIQFLPEGIQS